MSRAASVAVSILMMMGCAADEWPPADDDGEDPPDAAVRIDAEPPGANCADGGSAVHVGLDLDGDGALGDDEIESTTYVCDPEALVRIDAEPAGANCAEGGRAIRSGLDADGDGTLDDDEVTDTIYVCDEAILAALTRVDPEPAGVNCTAGGTAIASGLDLDADGTLDAGEVTHVDYVCDDAVLQEVAVEPAGPHCVTGGAAIHVGEDVDGDGTLDPAEVTATEYVCDGVFVGDLIIDVDAPAALAGIVLVTGDVETLGDDVTSISFPALRAIGGNLEIQISDGLTSFSAPLLAAVGGQVRVGDNAELQQVDLSGLKQVDYIYFEGNASLTTLDLGALESPGFLWTWENPISTLDVGSLRHVGEVMFADLQTPTLSLPHLVYAEDLKIVRSAVTSISIPALSAVIDTLSLVDDDLLASVTFPNLRFVGAGLVLRSNDAMTTFSFPELRHPLLGGLEITGNAALTGFSMPMLTYVRGLLWLYDNPVLASLDGLATLNELGGGLYIERDNNVEDLSDLVGLRRLGGVSHINDTTLVRLGIPNLREMRALNVGDDGTNPAMVALDLPNLRLADHIGFYHAPIATALELPNLLVVYNSFEVFVAPQLPRCAAEAVVGQLAVVPPVVEIHQVDDDGVCP